MARGYAKVGASILQGFEQGMRLAGMFRDAQMQGEEQKTNHNLVGFYLEAYLCRSILKA